MLHRQKLGAKRSAAGKFLQFTEKNTQFGAILKNFCTFLSDFKNRNAKSIHPPLFGQVKNMFKSYNIIRIFEF